MDLHLHARAGLAAPSAHRAHRRPREGAAAGRLLARVPLRGPPAFSQRGVVGPSRWWSGPAPPPAARGGRSRVASRCVGISPSSFVRLSIGAQRATRPRPCRAARRVRATPPVRGQRRAARWIVRWPTVWNKDGSLRRLRVAGRARSTRCAARSPRSCAHRRCASAARRSLVGTLTRIAQKLTATVTTSRRGGTQLPGGCLRRWEARAARAAARRDAQRQGRHHAALGVRGQ